MMQNNLYQVALKSGRMRIQLIIPLLIAGLGLWFGVWAMAAQGSATAVTGVCTVDDDAPADYSSIQTAVDDAACDPINVAVGYYTENITITRNVSIIGADRASTIVDGNGSRVFLIDDANAAVDLARMTIANGNGGSGATDCGGGIRNDGRLTLNDMLIINSYAHSGGGVCNNGTLTLTNSIIDFNQATTGGGLYNDSSATATIINSQISGHEVTYGGGGIWSYGTLTITSSQINNNSSADNGGGVGGGMLVDGPTLIEDSVIRNNFSDYGGGMTIRSSASVAINNSQILTNTASGINAGPFTNLMYGGGIDSYGTLTLTNSAVRGNNATGLFFNQYGYGGGIHVRNQYNGKLVLINTAVTGNTATGGAGISESQLSSYNEIATVEIVNSVISNNRGGGIAGGGIQHTGVLLIQNSQISGNEGAGIDHTGSLTLTQSVVSNNTAGGIESYNATIAYSTIRANTKISGTVGFMNRGGGIEGDNQLTVWFSTISGNSSGDSGGGVYFDGSAIEISSSAISDNTAGIDGGGIAVEGGDVTLTNVTMSGNTTDGDGGGVSFKGSVNSTAFLNSVTLTGNTADNDGDGAGGGGGLYRASATGVVSVTAAIIAENTDGSGFIVNAHDCSGDFTSLGSNLIGEDTACNGFTSATDQTGSLGAPIDPLLLPLADNGGPTWTHALDTGSPAIDNSVSPSCPAFDQRGVARPKDGDGVGVVYCDIGAYELGACLAPVTPMLAVAQDDNNLQLSWGAYLRNREVEVWRGADAYNVGTFSNIWTNPTLNTAFTDYDAIGSLQTDNFYTVRGQNGCGDNSLISNKVGEIDLGIQPGGNGRYLKLSLISVPLTGTIPATADTLAAHIDPNGSVVKVARWNRLTRSWIIRTVGSPFGTPDFPVSLGDVLMVAAGSAAPDSFAWVGDVPASGSIQYTLVLSNANFISIPLDQSGAFPMTADGLANDIGGVRAVAVWNRTLQRWIVRQVGVSGPDFTVRLGRPYVVLTDGAAPPVWP